MGCYTGAWSREVVTFMHIHLYVHLSTYSYLHISSYAHRNCQFLYDLFIALHNLYPWIEDTSRRVVPTGHHIRLKGSYKGP